MIRYLPVVLILIAGPVLALPRFSILTGMQCSNCHVNPTGGELRNSYGSSDFVDDHLRLVPAHSGDLNFNPQLNDNILLGGDVRFQYLYDGYQKRTTFQSMEGSIYSLVRLFTSTDFFLKYDMVNTAYEAYGKYSFNSGESYVKLGAFSPSYGIRLDDHTAYTRGGNLGFLQGLPQVGLMFVPDYRDLGIEVGTRFDNFFVTVDATNGDGLSNLNFTSNKAFIGRAEYLTKSFMNLMIGAEGYLTSATKMYGVHAGIGASERLSILAEYDWASSLPGVLPANSNSNAAFAEVTYSFVNGLYGMARLDYFRSYSGGPSYTRYIVGLNVYPLPHLDLMPQVRFDNSILPGSGHVVEALVQSHVYF